VAPGTLAAHQKKDNLNVNKWTIRRFDIDRGIKEAGAFWEIRSLE
jgi:hypothetical protein